MRAQLRARGAHVAELAQRRGLGLASRRAGGGELAHALVEVERELRVDVGVDLARRRGEAEQSANGAPERHRVVLPQVVAASTLNTASA